MITKAPSKEYSYYELNLGTVFNDDVTVRHPGFKEDLTLVEKIAELNNNLENNDYNDNWFYVIWDPYLSIAYLENRKKQLEKAKGGKLEQEEVEQMNIGFKKYLLARKLTDKPEINLIEDPDIGVNGITITSEYINELRLFNRRANMDKQLKGNRRIFNQHSSYDSERTTEEHYTGVLFVTSNLQSLTNRMQKLNWSMSFFNPKTPNKIKINEELRKQNRGRIIQFSRLCSAYRV
jgi:hypothetical protein